MYRYSRNLVAQWVNQYAEGRYGGDIKSLIHDLLAKFPEKDVGCSEYMDKNKTCVVCKSNRCTWFSLCDEHEPHPTEQHLIEPLEMEEDLFGDYPTEKPPTNKELMDKINEIIQAVNSIRGLK